MRYALLGFLRKHLPSVHAGLRAFRRSRTLAVAPVQTRYGFKLRGPRSIQANDFESEEVGQVTNLLRSSSVFVNVGANVGFYVLLARRFVKTVIAIEPFADNVELLERNLSINNFDDVAVFPIGCGDHVGLQKLYGGGTAASFVPGWAGAARDYYRLVPINTLDNIFGDRFDGEQVLILIDVEGLELDVLQGATNLLSRKPAPYWFLEICVDQHQPFPGSINPNLRKTFELLWSAGYAAERAGCEQGIVTADDVAKWERGQELPETHNFLFRKMETEPSP
jgi:FkbM family methyltransferase